MNYNKIEFEASYGTSAQLPPSDKPEIVFAGKSNVGKSSLLNRLFGRKNLARVSSVPGKTTTINFFRLEDIRFTDLPGYGYAKRSDSERRRWGGLMEGYFAGERDIRLLIQLLDMRHEPTADDVTMIEFLKDAGIPFVVALTKCDKLKPTERKQRALAFAENPLLAGAKEVIECSAEKGDGIERLKEIINNSLIPVNEEEPK